MNKHICLVLVLVLLEGLNVGQARPSGVLSDTARVRKFVHDPRIVENRGGFSSLLHGAPYSAWRINGSHYVVAYRIDDQDDPNDVVADIYIEVAQNSKLRKLITVSVFSQVDDVKSISVEGDSDSQLAFFRSSGQIELVTIVALQGEFARKLFDYGATSIKFTGGKPSKILAYSQSTDTTQTFVWCKTEKRIVLEKACGQKR